jgi:putative transposase
MSIREKAHRLQRDCYQGQVAVALTLCIKDRKPLFVDSSLVNIFTGLLRNTAEKFYCLIPAYCFMPDHVHIIAMGTQGESNLLKFINSYKQKTGFWLSKNKPAVSWQKDFYDHIIRKAEGLPETIRYILDNPVRQGQWLIGGIILLKALSVVI